MDLVMTILHFAGIAIPVREVSNIHELDYFVLPNQQIGRGDGADLPGLFLNFGLGTLGTKQIPQVKNHMHSFICVNKFLISAWYSGFSSPFFVIIPFFSSRALEASLSLMSSVEMTWN